MIHNIVLNVNNEEYELTVNSNETLLEVLRSKLHFTGVKEGCGIGECGSCVVILNGKLINSCLVLAVEANGARITTIEGIAKGTEITEIQQAFIEAGAVQCGFCTPGFILAIKSLLERSPIPTDKEIEDAFRGHLCRCTGYETIKQAVKFIVK